MNTAPMKQVTPLRAKQLDAVREISNIGAGHAATALSKMVDARVMISVPRVALSSAREMSPLVAGSEEPVVCVELRLIGDITGWTLLVFPMADALRLVELLLKRPASPELGKLEQSAIQEVGNILSSAYVSALGTFLGMVVIPMPPKLSVDPSASVIAAAYLQFGSEDDIVFRIESEFLLEGSAEPLRGFFLLIPDLHSMPAILRGARLQ